MITVRQITQDIRIGLLDLKEFSRTHNIVVKREQEKAGAAFVLSELLGTKNFKVAYSGQNKPYLAGRSEHISISHSHDKLVIIVNNRSNTGIDIELIRDKVLNIKHKFLNEKEAGFAAENTERLITIWAAKEAMYKCYGLKEVDFKLNLFVEDFDADVFFGKIEMKDFKKKFQLKRERIEDYMLVYILEEMPDKTLLREI